MRPPGCADRFLRLLTRLALGVFLLATPAASEAQGPSSLEGRVVDADGLPVGGAELRLEGTGLGAVADAGGRYAIRGLRPGTYRLVAAAPGYRAQAETLRVTREGESLRRDVQLSAEVLLGREILTLVEPGEPGASLRRMVRREELLRAGSVARALAGVPGVFVKEYGAGGSQQVSIRGGSPDQTLVLWNGERVHPGAGGGVDLSALPVVAAIDSVEVIGRGASSRYGGGALGGVVRIHSAGAGAPGKRSPEVRAGIASSGVREGSAVATIGDAGAGITLAGAARRYEENFGRRVNNGGVQRDAALSLHLPAAGLTLGGIVLDSERGAPGPVYKPTPRARSSHRRALLTSAYDGLAGPWSLRGELSFQVSRSAYRDGQRAALSVDSRETSAAFRGDAARGLGGHRLEAGIELRRDGIASTAVGGRPERRTAGVYLTDRWRLEGGRLALAPALRLDRLTLRRGRAGAPEPEAEGAVPARSRTVASPSLAATLELGPALALRAAGGRSFRDPGFENLFFLSGLGVRSNPELREERSRDLELGIAWSPRASVLGEVTVFQRRIEGAIVWLPDFQFIWSPRNLPRATVHGVEVSGRLAPRSPWEVNLAYTFAPIRFDFPGNGNPLPYRPDHLAHLTAAYRAGPLRVSLESTYTSRRYPNLAGTNALPAYLLLDASLALRRDVPAGELDLELRIENLTDLAYEVVAGFPGAGRAVGAALRYRLR
jgi:outer membrane receptor protein involved in Fe transport